MFDICHSLTVQHAVNWLKNPTGLPCIWLPIMRCSFLPLFHFVLFNLDLLHFDLNVFIYISLVMFPELKL